MRKTVKNDFWNPAGLTKVEALAFDDYDAIEVLEIPSGTSFIDTKSIDGWRQGVEITLQKHYDAGTVKILAGFPGHIYKQANFGIDLLDDLNHEGVFVDPQTYTYAPDIITKNIHKTHELSTNLDGNGSLMSVIEPLTKNRKLITARDADGILLKQGNVVKGSFGAGNSDPQNANDQIVDVYTFTTTKKTRPYFDRRNPDLNVDKKSITNNVVVYSDIVSEDSNDDVLIKSALRVMTGSRDNFISSKEVSCTCGYTYDNNVSVGTDSIVFGGMTY